MGDRTSYGDGDRTDAGDRAGYGDRDRSDLGDRTDVHAPAETGAAVAEPVDGDASRTAHEPAEERFDPTPTRDWAADEGALLDENQERADRLAEERAELEPDVPPVAPGRYLPAHLGLRGPA